MKKYDHSIRFSNFFARSLRVIADLIRNPSPRLRGRRLICATSRAMDAGSEPGMTLQADFKFFKRAYIGAGLGGAKYLLLLAVLTVAACVSDDDKSDASKHDKKTDQAKVKTDDLICPQVAILSEVQEKFDYGGEKPDPSQLVASAKMKSVEGDCAYQATGIDIAYTIHMVAKRGPHLGGDQASFPYFVAIIDPADNIISRQVITATFKFSGADKIAADDEALHVFIPLAQAAQEAGPAYRVLAGFEKR